MGFFVGASRPLSLVSRHINPCSGLELTVGNRHCLFPLSPLWPASQTRMVAAEATLSMTPEAVTLLSFLRAHKSLFSPGVGYNATSSALMRKNDTGKSAVPTEELDTNAFFLPGKPVGEALLVHWDEVVEAGRASLSASLPGVSPDSDVGKVLYYDVLMLLRVISYGVLVQNVNFLHENNMAMLVALYDVCWHGCVTALVMQLIHCSRRRTCPCVQTYSLLAEVTDAQVVTSSPAPDGFARVICFCAISLLGGLCFLFCYSHRR